MEASSLKPEMFATALKKGLIEIYTANIIEKVNICETMHWTWDYVNNMSLEDYMKVKAVLVGKSKRSD